MLGYTLFTLFLSGALFFLLVRAKKVSKTYKVLFGALLIVLTVSSFYVRGAQVSTSLPIDGQNTSGGNASELVPLEITRSQIDAVLGGILWDAPLDIAGRTGWKRVDFQTGTGVTGFLEEQDGKIGKAEFFYIFTGNRERSSLAMVDTQLFLSVFHKEIISTQWLSKRLKAAKEVQNSGNKEPYVADETFGELKVVFTYVPAEDKIVLSLTRK